MVPSAAESNVPISFGPNPFRERFLSLSLTQIMSIDYRPSLPNAWQPLHRTSWRKASWENKNRSVWLADGIFCVGNRKNTLFLVPRLAGIVSLLRGED